MIASSDLRIATQLADLPDDQLTWLAQQAEEIRFSAGEALFNEGEPADFMYVILEGQVQMRREMEVSDGRFYTAMQGEISGILPYSRMQTFLGTGRAVTPGRVARINKRVFPEMLQRMPVLIERLVGLMMDRVREVAKIDQQREKLVALGKLSAGLAHELNNPAGAAKRAASTLRDVRPKLREAYLKLDCRNLTPAQRSTIADFEEHALTKSADANVPPLSGLELSDREDELTEWMDSHGVGESWKIAPMLAEASIRPDELERVEAQIGRETLGDALNRCNLALQASRLVSEIEQSTTRISELVCAIKEYSYMDQAPEQEIDVHGGIESTLTILAYKLRKKSITVERDYDRSLPKICAYGVELNQVWTNLIVNAIEAMSEGGRLSLRTRGEVREVTVEVRDNGPGIPPELQGRIFEPFFTTKGVGEGSGLGLDTVMRVIQKHKGSIRLESKPGETAFTIRLPKQKSEQGRT